MRKGNILKIFLGLVFVMCMVGVKAQGVADSTMADKILKEASKHLGKPYRWGGRGPASFDCAGFVKYVYDKFGYHLGGSCVPQYVSGMPLTQGELEKGDLVFFCGRSASKKIGHVGIVSELHDDGSFDFIHAARTGVRYSNSAERYYSMRYLCACRVLPMGPNGGGSWSMPESIALDKYLEKEEKVYALMGGEDITDRLDAKLVEIDTSAITYDTLRLAFVGGVMMRKCNWLGKVSSVAMPFDEQQRLQDADLTIGKLDGTIGVCDRWFPRRFGSMHKTQMLPECAMLMMYAGLDVVSLSSEHCSDLGDEGMLQTTKYLDSVGIAYAGDRDWCKTRVVERKDYWYGYCSVSYDERFMDESLKRAKEVIHSMRDTVDIMVVNFVPVHDVTLGDTVMYKQRMARFARECVNYGADVVVGCNEMGRGYTELYQNRLIVYGVGDFCKPGLKTAPIAKMRMLSNGEFIDGDWYEIPADGEMMLEEHRTMNPRHVGGNPWGRR